MTLVLRQRHVSFMQNSKQKRHLSYDREGAFSNLGVYNAVRRNYLLLHVAHCANPRMPCDTDSYVCRPH